MPRKSHHRPRRLRAREPARREGKSRTEAFTQIAQERSSRPGTIAANYYRTARAQGASGGGRRRTRTRRASAPKPAATAATTRSASRAQDGDIGVLANQISDLVQQLVRQVQDRDQRLRELLG